MLQLSHPSQESDTTSETRRSHCSSGDDAPASSRALFRQLLAILLSVLAAFLFCEGFARVLVTLGQPILGATRDYDQKYAIALLPPEVDRPAVFCVGDSLSCRAVYSELLSARLADSGIDVEVRNLAASASWPMDQLFLLKLAVDRGVKPLAVIYDCAPVLLKADPIIASSYSPRLLSSYIGKCFVCERTDWVGHWQRLLNQTCYLVAFRAFIKEKLTYMIDRICTPQMHTLHYPATKTYGEASKHGWAPAYMSATVQELLQATAVRPEWRGVPGVSKSRPTNADVYATGPIPRYCAEQGIPLIFVWLPLHPTAESQFKRHLGMSAADCRNAFASAARRSGAWFFDLHDIDHDPGHFMDLAHTNAAGAVVATERLAGILKTAPLSTMLKERRSMMR